MQNGPWTVGALANHIWSVAGNDDDGDITADVPAAVRQLHHAQGDLVLPQHRVDLRLGGRAMVGADQRRRQPAGQDRRAARCSSAAALRYWAESPEFGPGLGRAAGADVPVPDRVGRSRGNRCATPARAPRRTGRPTAVAISCLLGVSPRPRSARRDGASRLPVRGKVLHRRRTSKRERPVEKRLDPRDLIQVIAGAGFAPRLREEEA